jgi:hypothetical protein
MTMRSYYSASIPEFLATAEEVVLGALEDGLAGDGFSRTPEQRLSWRAQVSALAVAVGSLAAQGVASPRWAILLEYTIAGRQKRLDSVILCPRGIIVVEFKIGKGVATSADRWQLLEYCWNLRDFHRASNGRLIAPILVPSELKSETALSKLVPSDSRHSILTLQITGAFRLAAAVEHASPRCLNHCMQFLTFPLGRTRLFLHHRE